MAARESDDPDVPGQRGLGEADERPDDRGGAGKKRRSRRRAWTSTSQSRSSSSGASSVTIRSAAWREIGDRRRARRAHLDCLGAARRWDPAPTPPPSEGRGSGHDPAPRARGSRRADRRRSTRVAARGAGILCDVVTARLPRRRAPASPRPEAGSRPRTTARRRPGVARSSYAWRGRSKGIGMSALRVPGRAVITSTRSPRTSASSIEWVMNRTVFRDSSQIRSSSSWRRLLFCSSSAANGSSISRISGALANARATETRCFMPPESWCGYARRNCAEPDLLDVVVHQVAALAVRDAAHPGAVGDVVAHGHPGEDRLLLEHHRGERAARVGVDHLQPAVRVLFEAGQDPEQRRLAAAGRPDDAAELAVRDHQVDGLERVEGAATRLELSCSGPRRRSWAREPEAGRLRRGPVRGSRHDSSRRARCVETRETQPDDDRDFGSGDCDRRILRIRASRNPLGHGGDDR